MRILLHSHAHTSMLDHVRKVYPNEGCGVLIGCKKTSDEIEIQSAVGTRNSTTLDTRDRYEIDPRDLLSIEKNLRQYSDAKRLLGFFHSHPDAPAHPSATDLEMAQGVFDAWGERYIYAIASINHGVCGQMTCWILTEDGSVFSKTEISVI